MQEKRTEGAKATPSAGKRIGINLTKNQFQKFTNYQISVDKLNRAKNRRPKHPQK